MAEIFARPYAVHPEVAAARKGKQEVAAAVATATAAAAAKATKGSGGGSSGGGGGGNGGGGNGGVENAAAMSAPSDDPHIDDLSDHIFVTPYDEGACYLPEELALSVFITHW